MQHDTPPKRARLYAKFLTTLAVSGALMLALMYLHTYDLEHVYWSETRAYMALIMVSAMALVMLVFMIDMYRDKRANAGIVLGSAALFALSLWLVRSQLTIDDRDYMEGMIPHHSIAILTSERARIQDARVRALADAIIEAQRREIEQMQWLIEDIEAHGPATTQQAAAQRPIPALDASP